MTTNYIFIFHPTIFFDIKNFYVTLFITADLLNDWLLDWLIDQSKDWIIKTGSLKIYTVQTWALTLQLDDGCLILQNPLLLRIVSSSHSWNKKKVSTSWFKRMVSRIIQLCLLFIYEKKLGPYWPEFNHIFLIKCSCFYVL